MHTHKHILTILATLSLMIAGALLSSTPVLAASGYKQIGAFGSNGPGFQSEPFSHPSSVAVDDDPASPSFEDVYVADAVAGTVTKFSASGVPISTLPLPEGTVPSSVAVDNDLASASFGDVYVLSESQHTVYKFTPIGTLVPGFELTGTTLQSPVALTVAASTGDLYIADTLGGPTITPPHGGISATSGTVDQFSPSGELISQITSERATIELNERVASGILIIEESVSENFTPDDVGVDSAGNVYIAQNRLDHSGVDKYSFVEGAWKFDGVIDQGKFTVSRLAVEPTTGEVYSVVHEGTEAETSEGVEWHDSSEALLFEFGSGNGFERHSTAGTSSGIAVNSETGTVYVTNDSAGRVDIFERVPLFPPTVTNQPVSSVLAESAVLNGSVNPNGLATKYHFEYWTSNDPEPVNLPVFEVGSGFEANPHTQVAYGLTPNTTYHVALVAINSEGTSTSNEQTFTTSALPGPEASTGTASAITSYTATIEGTLNPNGIETTYHFDIGSDTNYGAQIYGSGIFAEATPITLGLQDLQPGTTYHYRFVAVNQAGTTYGADKTFTTIAIPQAVTLPYIPPQISNPAINFPTETTGITPKTLTNTQKFAKALKACKKKPKKQRAGCVRRAHKQYPTAKGKKR